MNTMVEKMRKAREQVVESGGFKFTVRRPTYGEMMALSKPISVGQLIQFVVGWEGVKEMDLLSGGDPHPLAFNADVCNEWLSERMDLLNPLIEKIISSYQEHQSRPHILEGM